MGKEQDYREPESRPRPVYEWSVRLKARGSYVEELTERWDGAESRRDGC